MKHITINKNRMPMATAIAVTMSISAGQTVCAQEDSSLETSSFAGMMIEEVRVYGTKRASGQAAQDVAGQVSAFDSDQLAARQVVNIEDLAFSSPNVNLGGVGTFPGVASFFIRGQGLASSIPSIDPSVGVLINGIYQGITYGVITDTFDLESVEVHKGPQGVLFGRNVSAGAILLRSARPDGSFGIKSKVGIETGDAKNQYTAAFSVQGSLIENTLAGKLSVYHKDDGGYFRNNLLGGAAGQDRTQTERATLSYTPNDDVELTLIYEHGDQEGDGPSSLEQGKAGTGVGSSPAHGDSHSTDQNYNGLSANEWNQVTLEAGFDFGNGRITNILGYRDINSVSGGDVDADGSDAFQIHAMSKINQHQLSNELLYNISPTEDWDLTIGGYFFQQEFQFDPLLDMEIPSRSLDRKWQGRGIQDQQTMGVFINNDYVLSDALSISFGARYTEEEKEVTIWARSPNGGCTFNGGCAPKDGVSDKWTNTAPKLGLQWQFAEDARLYAHWSRAYRSGMYNMRTPVADSPVATDVEETNSYEIGLKSTWFNRSLRLNAAIFQNEITGMVIEALGEDPQGGPLQDFLNAGDATVNGIEIDLMWMLSDSLVINVGAGFLDPEYDKVTANLDGSDDDGDGFPDTFGGQSDKALEIKYMHEETYTLGFAYDMTIAGGSLSARANYNYRSEAMYKDDNSAMFPAYEQVNAGLTYRPNDGNWSLNLFAKNITDKTVVGAVNTLGSRIMSPMKKGRRFGLEFNYEI